MQEIVIDLKLATLPPIMLRGQHALIVVTDNEKKFVLGVKKFYPEGIYRLVGGGIEEGEEPLPAAIRELQEELGVTAAAEEFTMLAKIIANIDADSHSERVQFVTYLFHYKTGSHLYPSSDLDGVVRFSKENMAALIKRYQLLSPEIDSEKGFAWADYGQLYSQIHQIALDKSLDLL
jgi:8-oxo-dGTP pyrophosphatase MutT (NUDIX family)